MNNEAVRLLFNTVKLAFSDAFSDQCMYEKSDTDTCVEAYNIAQNHDISHMLYKAISQKSSLFPKHILEKIEKQQYLAIFRYQKLNHEFERLVAKLEELEIPFVILKGKSIAKYYPKAWLRTSCDIDVLVKESEVEKIADTLCKVFGYVRGVRGAHDISLRSHEGNHIELHYDLVENGRAKNSKAVLDKAWDNLINVSGKYHYELCDEMLYFYHIAHMAKHIENGGCGIRPFIDLWLLDNAVEHDPEKRDLLLLEGGLLDFANIARDLSEAWLEGREYTEEAKLLEEYILYSGVYGSTENRVASLQSKKGSKAKYIFSRIFLPYELLSQQYPVLQKHPILTPICHMRRWGRLFKKGLSRPIRELKTASTVSKEDSERVGEFLKKIGL